MINESLDFLGLTLSIRRMQCHPCAVHREHPQQVKESFQISHGGLELGRSTVPGCGISHRKDVDCLFPEV